MRVQNFSEGLLNQSCGLRSGKLSFCVKVHWLIKEFPDNESEIPEELMSLEIGVTVMPSLRSIDRPSLSWKKTENIDRDIMKYILICDKEKIVFIGIIKYRSLSWCPAYGIHFRGAWYGNMGQGHPASNCAPNIEAVCSTCWNMLRAEGRTDIPKPLDIKSEISVEWIHNFY